VSKPVPDLTAAEPEAWLEHPYCLRCGSREVIVVRDGDLRRLLPPEARQCLDCDAISWIERVGELGIQVGCLFWGEE